MIVRITYPKPNVWLDLWGGSSGTFNGCKRASREKVCEVVNGHQHNYLDV